MTRPNPIADHIERIARDIVDGAFRVHMRLGPGLFESVYETCLRHELLKRDLAVQRPILLPIIYDGVQLDAGLRLDLIVGAEVIVEVKGVEKTFPVHEADVFETGAETPAAFDQYQCPPYQRRNTAHCTLEALNTFLCVFVPSW